MAVSDKQLEYSKRHQSKLYRVPVYIPIDTRQDLEQHAVDKGYKSLNAYIKALIEGDSGISMSK